MARELLKRGWYLGFDGPVTYKNARRAPEVAAVTPLDRMLVETDSPFLSPRSGRNEPSFVQDSVSLIARIRNMEPQEIARITSDNTKRIYNIH